MLPALIIAINLVSCTIAPLDTNQNNGQSDRSISPPPAKSPVLTKPSSITSSMSDINIFKSDNGQVLTLRIGQTLRINLAENPTTGYRWSKAANLDTQVLQLKSDDFNLPSNAAIGAGGERVFTFQAQKVGQVKLQLKNMREWEGEQSAIERFEVTVRVTE